MSLLTEKILHNIDLKEQQLFLEMISELPDIFPEYHNPGSYFYESLHEADTANLSKAETNIKYNPSATTASSIDKRKGYKPPEKVNKVAARQAVNKYNYDSNTKDSWMNKKPQPEVKPQPTGPSNMSNFRMKQDTGYSSQKDMNKVASKPKEPEKSTPKQPETSMKDFRKKEKGIETQSKKDYEKDISNLKTQSKIQDKGNAPKPQSEPEPTNQEPTHLQKYWKGYAGGAAAVAGLLGAYKLYKMWKAKRDAAKTAAEKEKANREMAAAKEKIKKEKAKQGK